MLHGAPHRRGRRRCGSHAAYPVSSPSASPTVRLKRVAQNSGTTAAAGRFVARFADAARHDRLPGAAPAVLAARSATSAAAKSFTWEARGPAAVRRSAAVGARYQGRRPSTHPHSSHRSQHRRHLAGRPGGETAQRNRPSRSMPVFRFIRRNSSSNAAAGGTWQIGACPRDHQTADTMITLRDSSTLHAHVDHFHTDDVATTLIRISITISPSQQRKLSTHPGRHRFRFTITIDNRLQPVVHILAPPDDDTPR